MKEREQSDMTTSADNEQAIESPAAPTAPVMDMDVFLQIRDVVRTHYLWKWDADADETQEAGSNILASLHDDPRFRLVGDVDVEDDIFEVTLWLQDSMVFSLAEVDVLVLDALQIDLARGTVIARELTRMGLEIHLITFGDGRARQFLINVIGPRMQQIRDLGRLVVAAVDSFSA